MNLALRESKSEIMLENLCALNVKIRCLLVLYFNGAKFECSRFCHLAINVLNAKAVSLLELLLSIRHVLYCDRSLMVTSHFVMFTVPSFIQPIDNETIIEGGNVTLTCSASGFPTPTVFWVKTINGQRTNETELVFTNISRDQAGKYRCEATNLCNTATALATVDVLCKFFEIQLCVRCSRTKGIATLKS